MKTFEQMHKVAANLKSIYGDYTVLTIDSIHIDVFGMSKENAFITIQKALQGYSFQTEELVRGYCEPTFRKSHWGRSDVIPIRISCIEKK